MRNLPKQFSIYGRRFCIGLFCFVLGACATAVTSVSKDHVSIRYDMVLDSDDDLQRMANKECTAFGRKANFIKKTVGQGLGLGYAHYSCVDKAR